MENPVKVHLIFATSAIVLFISIMYVSLLPKVELPGVQIVQLDKLVHLTMYFILSVAIYKGFFNQKIRFCIVIASIMSFFYGIIVEFSQDYFTNTRMFDVFDILANGIGAMLAYIVVSKYLLTKK